MKNRRIFAIYLLLFFMAISVNGRAQLRFDDITVDSSQQGVSENNLQPLEPEVIGGDFESGDEAKVSEVIGSETSSIDSEDESLTLWEQIKKIFSSVLGEKSGADADDDDIAAIKSSGNSSNGVVSSSGEDPAKIRALKAQIERKYGVNLLENGSGWNLTQLKLTEDVFSSLPASFLRGTTSIVREKLPPPGKSLRIGAYVRVPQRKIHILDRGSSMPADYSTAFEKVNGRAPTSSEVYKYVAAKYPGNLVHEMTHCLQHSTPSLLTAWKKQFNPNSSPSTYGKTNQREDMAESVRIYWLGGKIKGNKFVSNSGESMDLARYNFIKTKVMSGKEYR